MKPVRLNSKPKGWTWIIMGKTFRKLCRKYPNDPWFDVDIQGQHGRNVEKQRLKKDLDNGNFDE